VSDDVQDTTTTASYSKLRAPADFLSALYTLCMSASLALHYMLTKHARYSNCQTAVKSRYVLCDGATYVGVPACLVRHLQARCGHVMQLHMLQVFFAAIQADGWLVQAVLGPHPRWEGQPPQVDAGL
jgi:hypothetical protein